jgi:hypothetical protein
MLEVPMLQKNVGNIPALKSARNDLAIWKVPEIISALREKLLCWKCRKNSSTFKNVGCQICRTISRIFHAGQYPTLIGTCRTGQNHWREK